MELFLPIAEMSVHWLAILGLGGLIGFLSGLFGVGGGFLLTPLLIFYGIPPAVAVATSTSQITAVTFSGVLAHWKNRNVDFKMGGLMLASGLVGTGAGVWLFAVLRRAGQVEIAVSASYVVLLGAVGALMLNESLRTLRAQRLGQPAPGRAPDRHSWIQTLPFKMRFRESRIYISVIPPVVLGFVVGLLSGVMGVGGGFIAVPAMIYLLKIPTKVVIGTSTFQILFVTAAATLFQAIGNYSVDIVLALILILGGVAGVQYGVRLGGRLKGEELRFLMALLVLVVALQLLVGLVATPAELYSAVVNAP
jgi:uncharacterized protein